MFKIWKSPCFFSFKKDEMIKKPNFKDKSSLDQKKTNQKPSRIIIIYNNNIILILQNKTSFK
jgi:hypothetical protein